MAIVKSTPTEQAVINQRLRKQYPQMFEPGWGVAAKTIAKAIKKGRQQISPIKTQKTTSIENQLRQAGLSDAEIKRLQGRK